MDDEKETNVLLQTTHGATSILRIRILNGPQKGQEALLLEEHAFTIGSSFEVTLRLSDPAVSRRHLELSARGGIIRAHDLGSTNGSYFEGNRFNEIDLRPGNVLRVGATELQVYAPEQVDPIPPSEATAFGSLLGKSRRMREIFAVLERSAKTDATVLITGETGTGKEVVAEAIHRQSPRHNNKFVVVDCASIPPNLIESELFGHLKGAYTNAMSDRIGAFEEADGGTVFLDEIGEMPPALQPRLLRVLETRTIKRIGANDFRAVDVRVIAATNRDLEEEVRARRFRSDLYFRLAVVRVELPPLRSRREDIPLLARRFLSESDSTVGPPPLELSSDVIAALSSYDWPGNVRELRNVLLQAASLSSEGLSLALRLKNDSSPRPESSTSSFGAEAFFDQPYKEARRQALEAFELAYAEHVLAQAGGNVSKAADLAQVHRNVLHRILARRKS